MFTCSIATQSKRLLKGVKKRRHEASARKTMKKLPQTHVVEEEVVVVQELQETQQWTTVDTTVDI